MERGCRDHYSGDEEEIGRPHMKAAVPPHHPIPAPTFDGTEDVDTFITSYEAIAKHNRWSDAEKKLRLQLSLKGPATMGTNGDSCEEVYDKLQSQYGLTTDMANTLLRGLKLKPKESVHKFGEKVITLVKKAYPNLTTDQQDQQAKQEVLCAVSTMPQLAWTLRLSPPSSLAEAVDIIHKYRSMTTADVGIHRLETEDVQDLKKQIELQAEEFRNSQKEMLDKFASMQMELTQKLVESQRQLATSQRELLNGLAANRRPRTTKDIRCYNCQGLGHISRDCRQKKAGNESVQQS